MRWYTVPCDEQFCFQHLHAIKGMGSGAAGKVWQEQTDHKLVRHPALDSKRRLQRKVELDATARRGIGCYPGDVKTRCLIRSM